MDVAIHRVKAVLADRGSAAEVVELRDPAPTAEAAAEQLNCEVGAIANSLIFDADGEPLLVLASGAHRVDVKLVARQLSVRKVRRASPEFVAGATGQNIGGVAPLGHPKPVKTIVDAKLAEFPVVWAGAGTESALFSTTADELVALTGGSLMTVGSE